MRFNLYPHPQCSSIHDMKDICIHCDHGVGLLPSRHLESLPKGCIQQNWLRELVSPYGFDAWLGD